MAERLFRRAAGDRHEARSAGADPHGSGAEPGVVEALAELGIDASDHVQHKLEQADIDWADVVIAACDGACPVVTASATRTGASTTRTACRSRRPPDPRRDFAPCGRAGRYPRRVSTQPVTLTARPASRAHLERRARLLAWGGIALAHRRVRDRDRPGGARRGIDRAHRLRGEQPLIEAFAGCGGGLALHRLATRLGHTPSSKHSRRSPRLLHASPPFIHRRVPSARSSPETRPARARSASGWPAFAGRDDARCCAAASGASTSRSLQLIGDGQRGERRSMVFAYLSIALARRPVRECSPRLVVGRPRPLRPSSPASPASEERASWRGEGCCDAC